jgi:protein ImuB
MSATELYLCLHAKELAVQAQLRLRPLLRSKPVAVLAGEPPLQHVCSMNRHARTLGMEHGMTRAELDTFPAVVLLRRSAEEETAAKAAAFECAAVFSPRIEDFSGANTLSCVVDIQGTERLFGPPESIALRLLQRLKALGVDATIAVGGNVHAVRCAAVGADARSGPVLLSPGREREALAPLPLRVLGVSDEHRETLALWGIRTLGALAALPETQLIARMGQEGKRLRQLARGDLPHLFRPVEPALKLQECIELESPVEVLESLLFVLGMLLEQLITRAANRILSLAAVTVTLQLERGGVQTHMVRPALPTSDKQSWLKLLHLDMVAHPPPAAVVGISAIAEPGSTSKVQMGLFSPQLPEEGRLDITLARLRGIVGEDRVGSAELKDTHKPDSFLLKPFAVAASAGTVSVERRNQTAMRWLRPAQIVTMIVTNHRPRWMDFRGVRYEVQRAYGPWLASGSWWSGECWESRQWDVIACDPASKAMLCCCMTQNQRDGQWQIEALYD